MTKNHVSTAYPIALRSGDAITIWEMRSDHAELLCLGAVGRVAVAPLADGWQEDVSRGRPDDVRVARQEDIRRA